MYHSIAALTALYIQQFHTKKWQQKFKFLNVCLFRTCKNLTFFKIKRDRQSITLDSFDISKKECIKLDEVQFEVIKQFFGGVLRRAFNSSSDNIIFQNKSWVLKKYHDSSKNIFDELGTDVECPNRKAVQMCCLQGILHLHLNYSSVAISTNLDSALVTTKFIMVFVDIFRRRNRIFEAFIHFNGRDPGKILYYLIINH